MRETQQARVLNYLLTHKTMTRNDAVNYCSCHKLPTVIGRLKQNPDLKKRGIKICGEMTDGINKFGDKVRYMTYWVERVEK